MTTSRWRASRVVVLCAAAGLALLGVAALPTITPARPVALRTQNAAGSTADNGADEKAEAATTTSTTVAPPTTVTTAPTPAKAKPATTTTKAHASGGDDGYGPEPPGLPKFSYEPGRTVWEATHNGIALKISIDTATISMGQSVTFSIDATSSDKPCCGIGLLFGDGSQSNVGQQTCPNGPTGPGTRHTTFKHTYNKAKQWTFYLNAWTGNCDVQGDVGGLKGVINVEPGQSSPQGPSLPTVTVDQTIYRETYVPGTFQVYAHGVDEDGYITRFEVDWGDGSPIETAPGDPAGCRPNLAGWPAKSDAWMPSNPPRQHTYYAGGNGKTFTITVTAVSVGCDGQGEQRGSGTFNFFAY